MFEMHWTVVEKVQLSNKKQSMQPSTWSFFYALMRFFKTPKAKTGKCKKLTLPKKSVKPNQRKATKTNRKEGRKEAESRKKSKITYNKNTELPSCARKKEIHPFNLHLEKIF